VQLAVIKDGLFQLQVKFGTVPVKLPVLVDVTVVGMVVVDVTVKVVSDAESSVPSAKVVASPAPRTAYLVLFLLDRPSSADSGPSSPVFATVSVMNGAFVFGAIFIALHRIFVVHTTAAVTVSFSVGSDSGLDDMV
jgi:hypothetical protein